MTTFSRIAPLLVFAAACGRPARIAPPAPTPLVTAAADAGLAGASAGDAAPADAALGRAAAPPADAAPAADASPAPDDGEIFRRADGTCWWHRAITCPANTDCVPPAHRQVACPAAGGAP